MTLTLRLNIFKVYTCRRSTVWLGSSVGLSARTVCERSWVRVPVEPCAFSAPVTFGGQSGSVLGLRAAKGLSRQYRHVSEQIRGRIYLSRGELSQVDRVAR